jgi:hypothetical protein
MVALMNAVCVIEAEYAAFVHSGHMRQEKGEIVFHNLIPAVDPDFLAKNADPARTTKSSLVVGVFGEIVSSHEDSISGDASIATAAITGPPANSHSPHPP